MSGDTNCAGSNWLLKKLPFELVRSIYAMVVVGAFYLD